MLKNFSWNTTGYIPKHRIGSSGSGLSEYLAERIFQLDPEPPVHENLNDYIIKAVQRRELRWFSFFLHHYENRLNGRIRRFLLREGLDRYDPERFLYYKMGCVLAMLDCLREYAPAQGADFLTYAHHWQSRNMPRKTVAPRRPQRSFWRWPSKIAAVFRFIRPFRMRTAKKPERMSAGMTIGTMRRFYGTVSGLKLSEKRLKS